MFFVYNKIYRKFGPETMLEKIVHYLNSFRREPGSVRGDVPSTSQHPARAFNQLLYSISERIRFPNILKYYNYFIVFYSLRMTHQILHH